MTDSKPKRTKTKKSTSTKKKTNKVVWLFGVNNTLIRRQATKFFKPETEEFFALRERLGIKLDTTVLPVFPDTQNRLDTIGALAKADFDAETVILVIGQVEDQQNKKIKERKGDEFLFVHPAERQFYIDTGISAPGSYKEATKKKEELVMFFKTIFTEIK